MGIKLFIVDDHYMIIEGIRSLLQQEAGLEWLGHAMTADSCLAFLEKQRPDVIFMDVNLPDENGIDLCLKVKKAYPKIHIIGLSSFNQYSFIEKMLHNGASGYVLKNAVKEELLEAIETVLEGNPYISKEVETTITTNKNLKMPLITRREKEILLLIAEGLTNGEIAGKIFVSTTTVDTHRKNLLTKFEVKNTAALVRLALQYQLI